MDENAQLFERICSIKNLYAAFRDARKNKATKDYVVKFEKNLFCNLLRLRFELLNQSYSPKQLLCFVIREPKTRKISKSDFRDRIVHHALCSIIAPIFEKIFIHDSYANIIGKGTLKAIERFENFKRKAGKNNTKKCFILKADIKHFFETVDQNILFGLLKKKISDEKTLWLMDKIIKNYSNQKRGMPLGNLTSQLFANIYLNELDQFVKHKLKAGYYISYVDDFVILERNKKILYEYRNKINHFLKEKLKIELHPEKTKIILLSGGVDFLGLRIFYHHRILKKQNIRKMKVKLNKMKDDYDAKKISYDRIYDFLEGWLAYAKNADTYSLRKEIIDWTDKNFAGELSSKEINRLLRIYNGFQP